MSHRELIQALRLYPTIVRDFTAAIPPEKLHHRIGPGFWTVYEHLEHLVQTQEVIHQRLKTIRDNGSSGGLWTLERAPAQGDREGP